MKTLVVGDLHGKYEIAMRALEFDGNIIFIGDYVDSYDRTTEEELMTLDLVLDAIKSTDGRVRGLLGNHEMGYIDTSMGASRSSVEVQIGMMTRPIHLLESYIWLDGILLSHAGVSQKLLNYLKVHVSGYLDDRRFNQIGDARRNYVAGIPAGGLFWCDWWKEFDPVSGLRQVVGHSRYRPPGADPGVVTKGENYNIDCLDTKHECLVITDGKVSFQKV